MPREVDAGIWSAGTFSSFAAARQMSSRLTLAISALAVEADLELAPADVLGEEPEVVALERVGGEFIPVAHHLRMLLDHLAGDAVVELALDAVRDVLDRALIHWRLAQIAATSA